MEHLFDPFYIKTHKENLGTYPIITIFVSLTTIMDSTCYVNSFWRFVQQHYQYFNFNC